MTIKDLCFQAQSSLQSRYATAVKRSHMFEVLAALFGYRSHAAVSAEALYAQAVPNLPPTLLDETGALARARRCGYTVEESKAIVSTLSSLARAHRVCVTTIDAVLRDLDATDGEGFENPLKTPRFRHQLGPRRPRPLERAQSRRNTGSASWRHRAFTALRAKPLTRSRMKSRISRSWRRSRYLPWSRSVRRSGRASDRGSRSA